MVDHFGVGVSSKKVVLHSTQCTCSLFMIIRMKYVKNMSIDSTLKNLPHVGVLAVDRGIECGPVCQWRETDHHGDKISKGGGEI